MGFSCLREPPQTSVCQKSNFWFLEIEMSPASADKKDSVSSDEDGTFLCGVVEGFYGRPWTTEQRKELFTKMQVWCVLTYICIRGVCTWSELVLYISLKYEGLWYILWEYQRLSNYSFYRDFLVSTNLCKVKLDYCINRYKHMYCVLDC